MKFFQPKRTVKTARMTTVMVRSMKAVRHPVKMDRLDHVQHFAVMVVRPVSKENGALVRG